MSPARPGGEAPAEEVLAGLYVVQIPLRVPFRGIRVREAALLQGPLGWGEFSPFLEYDVAEASRWLAAALEAAWEGWPDPVRDTVPVNATVPAVAAREVAGVLDRFDGCTTAKVKVAERGQGRQDDLDRVAAVRDHLGPDARIRVDANGGWDVRTATDTLAALAPYGLEYAEQPCASVEDLASLRLALARAGVDVLVAADESVRRAEDPLRVARLGAADLVVLKVAPLGGVRRAQQIAVECGLPVVVSSALDTSVGMSAAAALAAALPELPYACGLGTVELLAGDVAAVPLVPAHGVLTPVRCEADPGLLKRWAAPPDRYRWWHRRVADCLTALEASRG